MPPTAPSQPLEFTLENPATGEYSIETVAGAPATNSKLAAFIFRVTEDGEDTYIFQVLEKLKLGQCTMKHYIFFHDVRIVLLTAFPEREPDTGVLCLQRC